MTNFWQCSNCLDFFQAKDLTITDYITLDLEKMYILVCDSCLEELIETGILEVEKVEA